MIAGASGERCFSCSTPEGELYSASHPFSYSSPSRTSKKRLAHVLIATENKNLSTANEPQSVTVMATKGNR